MNCVDAGNVLVHLFLQTKTRYALTNKKLQYLLIIAQMSRLSLGDSLFDDDIRNFRQSFVLDVIGNNFLSDSDIVSGKTNDKPITCDKSKFVLPYSKKKIFELSQLPSEDDKNLLISVFLAFGAYSEKTLGRLLGEFKVLRSVPVFSVVPKDKISDYLSKSKDSGQNAIFIFIAEQKVTKTVDTPAPQRAVPAESPQDDTSIVPDVPPSPPVEKDSLVCAVPPQAILKGIPSLRNIIAGKEYSVLVELSSPQFDCYVSVISVVSNEKLAVVRRKLSDTLYRFSFVGIASDIRISAHVVS